MFVDAVFVPGGLEGWSFQSAATLGKSVLLVGAWGACDGLFIRVSTPASSPVRLRSVAPHT